MHACIVNGYPDLSCSGTCCNYYMHVHIVHVIHAYHHVPQCSYTPVLGLGGPGRDSVDQHVHKVREGQEGDVSTYF